MASNTSKCKARDTRFDKISNATIGWKIVSCVILSDFCRLKSDGTRSDPHDVISSLLEKDNFVRAHCFKNKKHGFMNTQLELKL